MSKGIESPDYRYGQWLGNEKGQKQKPGKCVEEVWPRGQWIPSQCSFKRKYGLYCGKHRKNKTDEAHNG